MQFVPVPHPKTNLSILGTSLATQYTPDSNRRPILCSVTLCNTHSTTATVDVVINNGSTDYYLLEAYSLDASETYVLQGPDREYLALETDWVIKTKASVDAVVHCSISLLETEGRKVT